MGRGRNSTSATATVADRSQDRFAAALGARSRAGSGEDSDALSATWPSSVARDRCHKLTEGLGRSGGVDAALEVLAANVKLMDGPAWPPLLTELAEATCRQVQTEAFEYVVENARQRFDDAELRRSLATRIYTNPATHKLHISPTNMPEPGGRPRKTQCGQDIDVFAGWFNPVQGAWHDEPLRQCESCAKVAHRFPECAEEGRPLLQAADTDSLLADLTATFTKDTLADPTNFQRPAELRKDAQFCAEHLLVAHCATQFEADADETLHRLFGGDSGWGRECIDLQHAGVKPPFAAKLTATDWLDITKAAYDAQRSNANQKVRDVARGVLWSRCVRRP